MKTVKEIIIKFQQLKEIWPTGYQGNINQFHLILQDQDSENIIQHYPGWTKKEFKAVLKGLGEL